MIWINKDSTEEEVIQQLKKLGLIKRNSANEMSPSFPPKRPFTFQEERILKEKFSPQYRWSDIDANGNIILIERNHSNDVGKSFITEQDLKDEIERRKRI